MQSPFTSFPKEFFSTVDLATKDWKPCGGSLQRNQGKHFVTRRKEKQVGTPEELAYVVLKADEDAIGRDPELAGFSPVLRNRILPPSDYQELKFGSRMLCMAKNIREPFALEVPESNEGGHNILAGQSIVLTERTGVEAIWSREARQIDWIANDRNLVSSHGYS